MYDREEAVETLRPSSSSSSSNRNPAGDQHRLFNHPYSNPTNRHDYNRSTSSLSSSGTVMGRTERLMDELEVINTFPASFATRPPTAPLPSPPPTASQFRNPSLNSSPVPSSTHPLKPVYPDSPTSSVYSLPFNPARDAHSQKISQAEKIADNFRSDSISLASTSPHPFDSILRPSTSTTSPSPPRLDSRASKPFSSYEKPGSVPESESKAQAALQEKQRGRRKLKWWGVFWIVVIAGIAMGIGIAAVKGDATKKAENGKEAGAGESKSEELGTPSSMRGVEMSREIGSGTSEEHERQTSSTESSSSLDPTFPATATSTIETTSVPSTSSSVRTHRSRTSTTPSSKPMNSSRTDSTRPSSRTQAIERIDELSSDITASRTSEGVGIIVSQVTNLSKRRKRGSMGQKEKG